MGTSSFDAKDPTPVNVFARFINIFSSTYDF